MRIKSLALKASAALNLVLGLLLMYCAIRNITSACYNYTITSDIWNWPNQEAVKLDHISANAVDSDLNVFNDRFVIQYKISGVLQEASLYSKGWKPYLRSFQITYRVNPLSDLDPHPVNADVLIVPIVDLVKDDSYHGEKLPFKFELRQRVRTFMWGPNLYNIHCGNLTCNVTVNQNK